MKKRPELSIVVPTFNEQHNILFLRSLRQFADLENVQVLVIDRQSRDATGEIVNSLGFDFYSTHLNSRAARLSFGFKLAEAPLVLFHHPRSYIENEGLVYLIKNRDRLTWGGFRHSFDFEHPLLTWTSWYSNNIRAEKRGIVYLDHCIFFQKKMLSREIPNVDIFEDTEISRILCSSGSPEILPFDVTTSAERFQHNGVYWQSLKNQVLKCGYWVGAPSKIMNRIYERGLSLNSKY